MTDAERKIRETYEGLRPDPEVKTILMESLPRERTRRSRTPVLAYAALAAAACLLVIAALWMGGSDPAPSPGADTAKLLFHAEGDLDATSGVMLARLKARGLREVVVQPAGPAGGLEVLLPKDAPLAAMAAMLMRPGTLEFLIVVEEADRRLPPGKYRIVESTGGGEPYWLEEPAEEQFRFRGEDIEPRSVRVEYCPGPTGLHRMVPFSLREERKTTFSDFTHANIGRRLAIVVDGRVESAPIIRDRLPGVAQITGGGPGGFTEEEAESLAAVLRSGPLPGEVKPR